MIKTGTARIIDVCSAFHVFTRHLPLDDLNFECSTGELLLPVRIYCASTLCKLLFSNELARRLKESQHGKKKILKLYSKSETRNLFCFV